LPFARTVTDTEQYPFLTATTLLFLMRQNALSLLFGTLIEIVAPRGTVIFAILAIVVRLTGAFLDTRLAIDCVEVELAGVELTPAQGTDIAAPTSHLLAATYSNRFGVNSEIFLTAQGVEVFSTAAVIAVALAVGKRPRTTAA
jgi:hypothetical protein